MQPSDNPTIVNLTDHKTITTAAECAAACCASPKVPLCNYAAFGEGVATAGQCYGGDWTKQKGLCRLSCGGSNHSCYQT